jgi:hypothetical protein
MFTRHLDRDAERDIVVHSMAGDTDNSCADAGEDCAHYGEVVASVVMRVEEYIHPFRCSGVVFGLLQ